MIKSVKFKKMNLEMKKPFKIALGSTDFYEGFLVSIETDDGITGYGEATTTPFITGDTIGSIESELAFFSKKLVGEDESPETVNTKMKAWMRSSKASRNAIDCALWDIIGKRANMNLVKLLGNHKKSILTSYTVDLVDSETAKTQAKELLSQGLRVFKIKVGSGIEEDLKRVKVVREIVGEDKMIYIDFNQAYSVKNAVKISRLLEPYNIEFMEQPIASTDISGLRFIRDHSEIPVYADETIFTPQDVSEVMRREAVDGINIKLMKSGGISDAMQMANTAKSFGVPVMIGCMVETRIANTSGLIVALSNSAVKYADLDGYNNIKEDPVTEGILMSKGEVRLSSDLPGTGISVKEKFLKV
ncbi:MAG: dipeptide epimerase [Candidatus Thermoplasmatota archaeon]|nr:dipeptide epimerase [Candidatus Thermoplasmatota archaeon]